MTSLAINCERCSFFLNDPGTDELYTRVAQGIRRQETVRLLNNEGIAGAAFLTGQSIIVDDAYADPRFNAAIDRETGYVTKTVLCVPIRTGKGEVIGVAQALNKVGGLFSKNDQTLLEGIAAQSVPALQSSQTVERMRKARAQELAFLDIVADITSQIDLDQLLQRVMTEANRMLGAERSTLFLHDDKTNELFSRVAMGPKIERSAFPTAPVSQARCSPPARRSIFRTPMRICASTRALTSEPGSSRAPFCVRRLSTSKGRSSA